MFSIFKYINKISKNYKQLKPIIILNKNDQIKKKYIELIIKHGLCLNKKKKCIIKSSCASCKIYNKYKHPDFFNIELEKNNKDKINYPEQIQNIIKIKNITSNYKIIVLNIKEEIEFKKQNLFFKIFENPPFKNFFLINFHGTEISKKNKETCDIIKIKRKYINYENIKFIINIISEKKNIYQNLKNENIIKIINFIICILKFLIIKKQNIYIKNLIKICIKFKKIIKKNPFLMKNNIMFFIKKKLNYLILFSSS